MKAAGTESLEQARQRNIDDALHVDIGRGDWTALLVPAGRPSQAQVVVRDNAVLCGLDWFDGVFAALDSQARIDGLFDEGGDLRPVPIGAGADDAGLPRVSGSLPGHYAPHTPLILVAPDQLPEAVAARLAQGLNIAVLGREVRPEARPDHRLHWQRALTEPAGYAHDLYAHLRALDAAAVDLILVERPPPEAPWGSVSDRLERAALGSGAEEKT